MSKIPYLSDRANRSFTIVSAKLLALYDYEEPFAEPADGDVEDVSVVRCPQSSSD